MSIGSQPAAVRKPVGWPLLLAGLAQILLGIGAIATPMVFTTTVVQILGIVLMFAGAAQLGQAFSGQGFFWHLLMALLYFGVGAYMTFNPIAAEIAITWIMGACFIAVGLFRLMTSFELRRGNKAWLWMLLSGLTGILLGGSILAQWPLDGLWVIGLFVGVELLMGGWALVMMYLGGAKVAS